MNTHLGVCGLCASNLISSRNSLHKSQTLTLYIVCTYVTAMGSIYSVLFLLVIDHQCISETAMEA